VILAASATKISSAQSVKNIFFDKLDRSAGSLVFQPARKPFSEQVLNFQPAGPLAKLLVLSADQSLPVIMYMPPSEPFFCHMESQVHRRTNLWIKLRAGNDATYMKMISAPAAP
jgi:hypothetical protein